MNSIQLNKLSNEQRFLLFNEYERRKIINHILEREAKWSENKIYKYYREKMKIEKIKSDLDWSDAIDKINTLSLTTKDNRTIHLSELLYNNYKEDY